MDLVEDHQLWGLAVRHAQSEQFHIGTAAIDRRLNTQAFDDLGVESLLLQEFAGILKVTLQVNAHIVTR